MGDSGDSWGIPVAIGVLDVVCSLVFRTVVLLNRNDSTYLIIFESIDRFLRLWSSLEYEILSYVSNTLSSNSVAILSEFYTW